MRAGPSLFGRFAHTVYLLRQVDVDLGNGCRRESQFAEDLLGNIKAAAIDLLP